MDTAPQYRGQSSSFRSNGRRHPHASPMHLTPVTDRNRYNQYSSDPTLIDGPATDDEGSTRSGGRRSAQDHYIHTQEEQQNKQDKQTKKKKMKGLKSFMHVFLGGLKKTSTYTPSHDPPDHLRSSSDIIQSTRYQQRNERDGLVTSVSMRTTADQRAFSPEHPPGLCGLFNHGNTCFMNAVLQCLSNTDRLAEYFVTDLYKNDLNRQKSAMKKFGTNGVVTEQFAVLLKCLWNGQYDPKLTAEFKDVVGKYNSQYQGSSQHDAQEFFLWLLDNVHEDLNQAGKKKYKHIKDSTGRPDEEVAAETMRSHAVRNNSFIQNQFQGQFRSVVICPSCGTRSATFDPYVCVSLPLPQRHSRPVYVSVVYRSSARVTRVYGVNISIDSTVRDLRNSLAELCGINRYHLVLCDLNAGGFNRTFYDDQHISVVNSSDLLFGFECPPYRGDNPEAMSHNNPSGSKELMLVLVVNKFGQTNYGKRFGSPLILRVWRDLTHQQFQSVVLKAMSTNLREGVRLPEVCRSGVLFQCRIVDGLPGRSILPTDADHPFYSQSVDKALHVSLLYGGPAHIKIVAEWEPETKAGVFGVVPDLVPQPHESVASLRDMYQAPLETSLRDCLKIYTREETLNREDSWYCPHCKQGQQDATKKITLWTVPDVLVLHLKRFRHVSHSRTKLNTLVKFPVRGLDMTPFLAPRSPTRPGSATLERRHKIGHVPRVPKALPTKSVTFQEPSSKGDKKQAKNSSSKWWKKTKKDGKSPDSMQTPPICDSPASTRSAPSHSIANGYGSPEHRISSPAHSSVSRSSSLAESALENIYDLYAVCNHTGSMNRGHYIAYCRNPADGRWYGFDDVSVQPVTEEQLITPGAYMLFYVRQSLLVQSPLSSSESSASSGSTSHWTQHIPHFRLDLSDTTPQHRPRSRQRLGSTNSAMSAPPTSGIRGFSPQSSVPDSDDVFHRHGNSPSAHSLPQYQQAALSQPSYPSSSGGYQRSHSNGYPQKHSSVSKALSSPGQARVAASGRHPSLRLGKVPRYVEDDLYLRRGASFHAPRHHSVKEASEMPSNAHFPQSRPVLPSRSIPNMNTDSPESYQYSQPLSQGAMAPCRSIPNMPQEMGPVKRYPQNNIYDHFSARPQAGVPYDGGRGHESCV